MVADCYYLAISVGKKKVDGKLSKNEWMLIARTAKMKVVGERGREDEIYH